MCCVLDLWKVGAAEMGPVRAKPAALPAAGGMCNSRKRVCGRACMCVHVCACVCICAHMCAYVGQVSAAGVSEMAAV